MNIEQKQRLYNTLEQLGLSTLEITVYLEILQMGSIQASVVARRLSLNRSTTRYTLENLVKKKLIIQSKKNSTFYFTPENPEKIVLLLRTQQAELKNKEQQVQNIMGDLKGLQNPNSALPKVQFFEGTEGLISIYEDILKESKLNNVDIFGYSQTTPQHVYPEVWEYLINTYTPARKKIGNKAFMIFPDNKENETYLNAGKELNRTTLLVPTEEFPFQSAMQIYGTKVALFSRQQGGDLSGILIDHPQISQDQFLLFKMAWKQAQTYAANAANSDVPLPEAKASVTK